MMTLLFFAAPAYTRAQVPPVTADVTITRSSGVHTRAQDFSQVVVWLSPLDEATRGRLRHDKRARHAEICRRAIEHMDQHLHAHV